MVVRAMDVPKAKILQFIAQKPVEGSSIHIYPHYKKIMNINHTCFHTVFSSIKLRLKFRIYGTFQKNSMNMYVDVNANNLVRNSLPVV